MIPDISASNEAFEELLNKFLDHRRRMVEIMDSIKLKSNIFNNGSTSYERNVSTQDMISDYSGAISYIDESLNDRSDALLFNLRKTSEVFDELTRILLFINKSASATNSDIRSNYSKGKKISRLLPPGFVWVNINQINPKDLTEGYNQTKFKAIIDEQWLYKLETVVLPAIDEDPTRGREFFRALDNSFNLSYPEGFQKIFERFFGDEHIFLSLIPGTSNYSIINGIHRILIAKQQGWTSIPAKIQ